MITKKSDRREIKVKIRRIDILFLFLITTNKVFIFINILLINMDKQIFYLSFEIFYFVYISLLIMLTISNHLFHKFFDSSRIFVVYLIYYFTFILFILHKLMIYGQYIFTYFINFLTPVEYLWFT